MKNKTQVQSPSRPRIKRLGKKGFTLIELIIVILIAGIMAALAIPSMLEWRQGLVYKNLSAEIGQMLRQARSLSVARNLEHRVEFDVDGDRFQLTQGNSSSASTTWTTIVQGWVAVETSASLMRDDPGAAGMDCDLATDVNIEFHPNGTSDGSRICILDDTATTRYQVDISATSGSIRVSRL